MINNLPTIQHVILSKFNLQMDETVINDIIEMFRHDHINKYNEANGQRGEGLCLLSTYYQSIKTGIFLRKLKLVKVIPVYKKLLLKNYRPISILHVVSMIF